VIKDINNDMFILDLFESPEPAKPGYQSEEDDNSVMKLSDLRKTRLTLAHLNRLRMANDVRKFEFETKMKSTHEQYGATAAPEGGAGGLPGVM
jgi:hypothetical protein